jgi:hypothetical protein
VFAAHVFNKRRDDAPEPVISVEDESNLTSKITPGFVVPIPTHPENIATGAHTWQAKHAIPVDENNSLGVEFMDNVRGYAPIVDISELTESV